jgi:hypothetical protein
MSLQYSGSCESGACNAAFGAGSSLDQGRTFANMTAAFHGGRRSRKAHRKAHRKNSRKGRRQYGGSAAFPVALGEMLPSDMRGAADISSLDKAYAQLPEFAGKYGMMGGALSPAPVDQPGMILTPGEERAAFLNPQWYTENEVVPSFKGPQSAGSRKSRKARKASRKARKASRKGRKASRKGRKASRKGRKASRKH